MNWLRERLPSAWQTSKAHPGAVVTTVLIAALILGVNGFRNRHAVLDWVKGGTDGKIIVSSPTVYTRQRLVNDRLSQTAWLQNQLKAADDNTFQSIDQLFSAQTEDRKKIGTAIGSQHESLSQISDAPSGTPDPIRIEISTPASFRAKSLYRDEVRSEITQTQLDDRHDLTGNTIYRLSFDATVIGGSKHKALAGIRATLSHQPFPGTSSQEAPFTFSSSQYADDYERLYVDWAQFMQRKAIVAVTSVSDFITNSSDSDDQLRQRLFRFLNVRLCQTGGGVVISRAPDNVACDLNGTRTSGLTKAAARTNGYLREKERMSFVSFIGQTDRRLSTSEAFLSASQKEPDQAALRDRFRRNYFRFAQVTCREQRKEQPGLQDLSLSKLFPDTADLRETDLATSIPPSVSPKRTSTYAADQIPCPFYDSPAERLKAAILVYDEGESRDKDDYSSCRPVETVDDPLKVTSSDLGESMCWFGMEQHAFRCLAADFVTYTMSLEAGDNLPAVASFLNYEVVGRETDFCSVAVTEKEGDIRRNIIYNLARTLNSGTESFVYSVNPKNLTENISTATEVRDSFELMARYGLAERGTEALADSIMARSSKMQAVLAHPIVVGFSSNGHMRTKPSSTLGSGHQPPKEQVSQDVDLGWIIAPRMRNDEFEQIDNQYGLTTVISVPSWWRSLELSVRTCWLSRDDLSDVEQDDESGEMAFCKDSVPTPTTIVRLPGAISELTRKLGVDVIEEPHLDRNDSQVLEIGQPGSLILRGTRLWRSTEVTVGSQKANSILVLPNMEGIIANFDCILPQFIPGSETSDEVRTYAQVWTSEGVASGAPVTLKWPEKIPIAISPQSWIRYCPQLWPEAIRNQPAVGSVAQ